MKIFRVVFLDIVASENSKKKIKHRIVLDSNIFRSRYLFGDIKRKEKGTPIPIVPNKNRVYIYMNLCMYIYVYIVLAISLYKKEIHLFCIVAFELSFVLGRDGVIFFLFPFFFSRLKIYHIISLVHFQCNFFVPNDSFH